jgi:hypothetical protein
VSALRLLVIFATAESVKHSLQWHFYVLLKSTAGHDRHKRTVSGGHVTGSAHLYNYCVIVHTDKLYRVFCYNGICAEGVRV